MGLRAWRSHDPWLRILSAFQTLALVTCVEECNVTAELYKIDARLNAIARKVNTRTIDNFVFGNKLTLLQEKIGEYQDEDRRLIVQINGLPAIKPENLYRVIESLGQVGIVATFMPDLDVTEFTTDPTFSQVVYLTTESF